MQRPSPLPTPIWRRRNVWRSLRPNAWRWRNSYNGVRSAVAAGMATIMAPDVQPATDEMRRVCVAIVGRLDEVIDRLG